MSLNYICKGEVQCLYRITLTWLLWLLINNITLFIKEQCIQRIKTPVVMYSKLCSVLAYTARANLIRQNAIRPALLSVAQKQINNDHQQRREYKNFGHRIKPMPGITKAWITFLLACLTLPLINYRW